MIDDYSDYLHQWKNEGIAPPPVTELLGIDLIDYSENGWAEVGMDVSKKHHNAIGTMHGGIFCDIVDVAMGTALVTRLEPGESFTTVEMKTNFFQSIREGTITAEAEVKRRGGKTAYLEGSVMNEEGELLSRANSTYMILT